MAILNYHNIIIVLLPYGETSKMKATLLLNVSEYFTFVCLVKSFINILQTIHYPLQRIYRCMIVFVVKSLVTT